MLHIRALIKPDRIIVFDSAGSTESEVSRKFKWHLERNIKAGLAARAEEELDCEEEDIGLVYEHRYVPRKKITLGPSDLADGTERSSRFL